MQRLVTTPTQEWESDDKVGTIHKTRQRIMPDCLPSWREWRLQNLPPNSKQKIPTPVKEGDVLDRRLEL